LDVTQYLVQGSYTIHQTCQLGRNSSTQPIKANINISQRNCSLAKRHYSTVLHFARALSPSEYRGNIRSHARVGNRLWGLRLLFNTERL